MKKKTIQRVNEEGLYRCCTCKTYKDRSNFCKDKKQEDEVSLVCRECRSLKYKSKRTLKERVYVLGKLQTRKRLVCGFGINDADYVVSGVEYVYDEDGNKTKRNFECPFYKIWSGVLTRLFKSLDVNRPTYEDVGISDEWKYFSNFKAWMEQQPWEGMHLDKDLLSGENKLYSPETCCFLPPTLNNLISFKKSNGAKNSTGVYFVDKKWMCFMTVDGVAKSYGRFATEKEAYQKYREIKASAIESKLKSFEGEPFLTERVRDAFYKLIEDLRKPL